jgi:hypothetical protein
VNSKLVYCSAPLALKFFMSFNCVLTSTSVFAAIVPEAATPGKPIPGKQVSPHASNPLIGVVHPGRSHYDERILCMIICKFRIYDQMMRVDKYYAIGNGNWS